MKTSSDWNIAVNSRRFTSVHLGPHKSENGIFVYRFEKYYGSFKKLTSEVTHPGIKTSNSLPISHFVFPWNSLYAS